jgi:hypothetical protein
LKDAGLRSSILDFCTGWKSSQEKEAEEESLELGIKKKKYYQILVKVRKRR